MLSLIECVMPAVHLSEVMVLEAVVEGIDELVDGNHSLVGHVGEHERIDVLGHVSEPQRGAELEFPVGRTPVDTASHQVR